jgi:UDP-glucose 6-dehydrogenase
MFAGTLRGKTVAVLGPTFKPNTHARSKGLTLVSNSLRDRMERLRLENWV